MSQRHLKAGYFAIEGLNSLATVYYLYYLYFFLERQFGFGNQANLAVAALNGVIYMVGSWWGGKFALRFGYFISLKLGFCVMAGAMAAGAFTDSAALHVTLMAVTVLGTCFTWPTLEALVTEGESPSGVQRMVGVYNVVWAFTAALGNFTGGAMLEQLGLKSLFYVPAAIVVGQLGMTLWLESQPKHKSDTRVVAASVRERELELQQTGRTAEAGQDPVRLNVRPIAKARMFLRLAWLANPFAYVALNTLIAVMPAVARRLELSTMLAGFCCSVWCFARLGAFVAFWLWDGWHYRFRGLLAAFLGLVATFAAILIVPNLAVVVMAQVGFGAALGLIYSSSLFYSMDLSESKSEHGGIHEAAIGLGNFVGPAVGAASGYLLPQYSNSGALAVIALLVAGLGGMLAIWSKERK